MPKTKTFILDTSVLLYSSLSYKSFGSSKVVIPYAVLEELDRFKTREGEVGCNARQVARELNELRQGGHLNKGVQVNSEGGELRVELNYHDPESTHLDASKADDRILNVCLGLQKNCSKVTLVTKDINLAVRADVLGIQAQDFDSDKTVDSISDMYSGAASVTIEDDLLELFYAGEDLYPESLGKHFFPNQYLTLVSSSDRSKTALVRVPAANLPLVKLRGDRGVWGIKPRNREQRFAMDALLNLKIPLVTLTGVAGGGKTLVALACALQQVQEEQIYDRLVVSRPVQPLGKDIGYLPGQVLEKMDPWMGPIKDSLEFLTRGKSKAVNMYEEMINLRMLEVEPLTYLRGRSMSNTLFIVDECQDTSPAEIKTIVTRMGENSKLVLIGDVMQVTNPYLDATNNGLSKVVERFKPYDIAAHITLEKGERSELATIAAKIL